MSSTTTAPPSASAAPTVAPGAGRETPGRTAPAITGRFVTVLPRSRTEDEELRRWIQTTRPSGPRLGMAPPPLCRRTARQLVRLSIAITVGGGLDGIHRA